MSYRIEKTAKGTDIVIDGWAKGIAQSPHKGIANIQNANIATETDEVMCSYTRIQQSQPGNTTDTHTITHSDATHLATTFTLTNGVWITVSASTITNLGTGDYYILNSNGTASGAATSFQVSTTYGGSPVGSLGLTGTATFTLLKSMGTPIAKATEPYFDSNSAQQYRYYILDNNALVWVYDTAKVNSGVTGQILWFLPYTSITYYGSTAAPSGIGVLQGWLHVFAGGAIWCKPTVNLGGAYTRLTTAGGTFVVSSVLDTNAVAKHFAFTAHNGHMYYTDGQYVGNIFPDSSLVSGIINIQSFASYTASTTTGTITDLISGTMPVLIDDLTKRIPVIFFTATGGTLPTDIAANTIFYIQRSANADTFQVYDDPTAGTLQDIESGSAGTQYFNTYYPISTVGMGMIVFTPQALSLPNDIATCITEVGNNLLVSGQSNIVYPWNKLDFTPSGPIFLPENGVVSMITVHQMVYIFAGNKGNIYITDGSVASLVLKVPDYCAGIAGTPKSYFEPVFTWGDAMYLRGRVYFSILDQTTAKAGNCGGIWSFYPTQNLAIQQDTGIALRLENQNSYGTYSGVATILIPHNDQKAISPRYWAGWYSSISSPLYGIDFTDTMPSSSAVVETDLISVGTVLEKKTFSQIEYKLASPLASGESVQLSWRANATDSYTSLGTSITESATSLSGYVSVNIQSMQWAQLKATLVPLTSSNSSMVRLTEIRMR